MIAIDTSSIVSFLKGESGSDVEAIDRAFELKHATLPPVVVTEILSDSALNNEVVTLILQIPVLDVKNGFWLRAGLARAKVLAAGHKARIADALIAQSCLDYDVALITRDRDFRHFARLCHLRLAE